MIKICKDCKYFRDIYSPFLASPEDLYKCVHPKYYKLNYVTGDRTYYNCYEMRNSGPCGKLKAELFEVKLNAPLHR